MKTYCRFFMAIVALLCSCNQRDAALQPPMQEVNGRNGLPIYRVRVREPWIRRDPLPGEDILDTIKPLCEFLIREPEGTIRIVIHNFPKESINERIPPSAQTARWQRQFDELYPNSSIISQSFSGYVGLFFSGKGIVNGKETGMLAWALQIGDDHYRALSHPSEKTRESYRQMRADVTIKATGPAMLIEKHKKAILSFVHSFELIEEIPH